MIYVYVQATRYPLWEIIIRVIDLLLFSCLAWIHNVPVVFLCVYEEFEDTKGVIRIRKEKKNRQHNGQKKKDKRTNNDLQTYT